MTSTIGRLKRIPFREVWPDEARDFTPWLKDNIDQLADELSMKLEAQGTEVPVGRYNLDLLAMNPETQGYVVVENQVGRADHDHLGKLITYAAGIRAEAVVWIAEEFGEEQRTALEWLNENRPGNAAFFGVEVRAVSINDSIPAATFTTILAPNEWGQRKEANPTELSEAEKGNIAYWRPLLGELKTTHKWGQIQTENKRAAYGAGSGLGRGFGNFRRMMRFTGDGEARVEFTIWGPNREWNKQAFDMLYEFAEEIEQQTGHISWERLDDSMVSRLAAVKRGSRMDPEPMLEEHRRWMIDMVTKLPRVLRPYLEQVQQIIADDSKEAEGVLEAE